MNFGEFALLALVCTVVPAAPKDTHWENPFTFIQSAPEFTEIARHVPNESCSVTVYEMRNRGTFNGYEFRFKGFAPWTAIIPEAVEELEYWANSYQIDKEGRCAIRASFKDARRPEKTFSCVFNLWKVGILCIDVPVEERRAHHEPE